MNETSGGVGTAPGWDEKGSSSWIRGQDGWAVFCVTVFKNSEESKNTKFANSGLLVCYEDIFVKARRYYILYLISNWFISFKCLDIQYMDLHLLFAQPCKGWGRSVYFHSSICFSFLLLFPFQPVLFSRPYCQGLLGSSIDLQDWWSCCSLCFLSCPISFLPAHLDPVHNDSFLKENRC